MRIHIINLYGHVSDFHIDVSAGYIVAVLFPYIRLALTVGTLLLPVVIFGICAFLLGYGSD